MSNCIDCGSGVMLDIYDNGSKTIVCSNCHAVNEIHPNTEWIEASKEKPEHMVDVVCYCNDIVSSWQSILRWDDNNLMWCDYWGEEFECIVTHWHPTRPNP